MNKGRKMKILLVTFISLQSLIPHPTKTKPAAIYSIPLPPKPDFTSLDWLIGEWVGKIGSRKPQGDVRFSASYDLDQRFMIIREEVSLPATKNAPATGETWMGVVSAERADSSYALRSFSSTGFISRYLVTVNGDKIYFNPEGGEQTPAGWLFRRTIQRLNPVQFAETVRAAPADQPFFDYFTATLTRVILGKQSSPSRK